MNGRLSARDVARRVLVRVADGAFATLALGGELERARLSDADRALCTELVYGVLKQRRRLEHALAALTPRGLGGLDERTLDALLIGAHQILFLRVPAHAAVDDAVEAVKRVRGAKLAGFVNALLRKLAASGESPLPTEPKLALAIRCSAPDWLVDEAVARFGLDEAEAFLSALNRPAPLWLRVVGADLAAARSALMARLTAERPGITLAPSAILDEALRADGGGDLTRTRAFAEGAFAIQDLAAQIVARVLDPQDGERILDGCAGVGGKSLHLAALAPGAMIDCADTSERKLGLLADQAHRLGLTQLHTVVANLTRPLGLAQTYDRVLIDAPCSGLGVLRRHPESKWRPRDLHKDAAGLARVGAAILDALAPKVRPGGVLVYSVCTFTDEEGPQQLAEFLRRHPSFTVEKPTGRLAGVLDLVDDTGALRTWPQRHDADGFYIVRLRNRETT